MSTVHESAVALIEPQASSAGVEIETECPDASSLYLGYEDRVRQILVILLSNAVKFTDPAGTITVSCGASTAPDEEATLVEDGRWTFIRVADTGIGSDRTGQSLVLKMRQNNVRYRGRLPQQRRRLGFGDCPHRGAAFYSVPVFNQPPMRDTGGSRLAQIDWLRIERGRKE